MDSDYLTVPEAIALIRKRRGWSQRQLAAAVGHDRTTIQRWERHKRGLKDQTMQAIAQALRVSPSLLFQLRPGDPRLQDLQPFAAEETADAPARHVPAG